MDKFDEQALEIAKECGYRSKAEIEELLPYARRIRVAVLADGATTQNPYQQFAEGNHSIGIIKDGKLIATDEQVYAAPSSRVSVPRITLEFWRHCASKERAVIWLHLTEDMDRMLAAAPPAPDEDGERIAALTAERDRLQQSLIAEEDEYVKLLAECEDLKHDIARHVDIASKEASARIEAEARLATVPAETIGECAKVCDPNGMSAEEYCKISNYVIQRDIQRYIALMKNLAEAIRALKEPL